MRLDKFLKVSRLIKRRTVAKEVCDGGRVLLNGQKAKAGSNIKVEDLIEITWGTKTTRIKVLKLADNVPASQASEMYEVINN